MIRKRVPKLLTILAGAACIFGLVLVAPAGTQTPTLSPMPVANAQVMPNGFDVNCTKVNDLQVLCTVAGCPVVYEDYVADKVHTHINHDAVGQGDEQNKACNATYSRTINIDANKPLTFSVQGCDSVTVGDDNCGPYSHYEYVPPPQPPVQCGPNDETPTVPAGQQCKAKAMVKCPDGSPTTEALSLDKCAPVPDKQCPPGSASPTVPSGQQCGAVTNAISMNITQEGLNANVTVNNSSPLPAECAYTATKTGGLLGPGTVNRNVSVPANGAGNITDMLWPPPLVSYRATVKCTAQYDGKTVTIGESTQNVSG